MAWTEDFRSGIVQIDTGSVETINGITQLRISANSEVRKEITGGSPWNRSAHVVRVDPVAQFTTVNVGLALEKLGAAAIGSTDVRLIGQKQTASGVAAGAVHAQYAGTICAVVASALNVDHQGNAQITYDVFAASPDGNAAALAKTLVSMPAIGTPKRFRIYSLEVAGNVLEGKRNVSINWNSSVSQESADSVKFPTTVNLSSQQPVVTARGVDPDWLSNISLGGEAGLPADTILSLKNRDELTATGEHITIAFNCAVSWQTLFEGGPDGPAEAELRMDVNSPTGVAPFTVSTTATL